MISDRLSIITKPQGAHIDLMRFDQREIGKKQKQYAGVTPIHDLRIARGDHLVFLEMEGYVSTERLAYQSVKQDGRMGVWSFCTQY